MAAYTLKVFYPGETAPSDIAHCQRASQVVGAIETLLAAHAGCERIRVEVGAAPLFTVNCKGETIEE